MLDLTVEKDAILLPVKVVPGSRATRCLGIWDGRARIAVSAPPEKGKANKAVAAFLAEILGIRRNQVTIMTGHSGPLKTIKIENVSEQTVRQVLQSDRS